MKKNKLKIISNNLFKNNKQKYIKHYDIVYTAAGSLKTFHTSSFKFLL